MIKKTVRYLNMKLNPFKTIPASEVFKDRPLVRSNVPGAYLMDGVTNQYLSMNNAEYSEKIFRKENNLMNEMDKLEDDILNNIRKIIYDYYNYPYKVIPILNKECEYRTKIIKLNQLINDFVKPGDSLVIDLKQNSKYNKYMPSGLSLTKGHEMNIDKLIGILENKKDELNEIIQYEIYSDTYSKLVSLNSTISKVLSLHDSMLEERIDFNNDYFDRRTKDGRIQLK